MKATQWHTIAVAVVAAGGMLLMPAYGQGTTPREDGASIERQQAQQAQLQEGSKLIGKTIKSTDGKKVGTVEDIMLSSDGDRIDYVVLASGGFLGVGKNLHALPWRAFQDVNADGELIVTVTSDKLKNAQGFTRGNWPDAADQQWRTTNDRAYGLQSDTRDSALREDRRQSSATREISTDGNRNLHATDMGQASQDQAGQDRITRERSTERTTRTDSDRQLAATDMGQGSQDRARQDRTASDRVSPTAASRQTGQENRLKATNMGQAGQDHLTPITGADRQRGLDGDYARSERTQDAEHEWEFVSAEDKELASRDRTDARQASRDRTATDRQVTREQRDDSQQRVGAAAGTRSQDRPAARELDSEQRLSTTERRQTGEDISRQQELDAERRMTTTTDRQPTSQDRSAAAASGYEARSETEYQSRNERLGERYATQPQRQRFTALNMGQAGQNRYSPNLTESASPGIASRDSARQSSASRDSARQSSASQRSASPGSASAWNDVREEHGLQPQATTTPGESYTYEALAKPSE